MFSAALKSGAAAAPLDPDFEYVTMLLHGDGTNGAQNNTFLDSSTNNFTITRNGNTTQGSFSPYGPNWSNFFDGSGDYLTANNAALNFGTGDFTMETWVYAISLANNPFLMQKSTGNGSSTGWFFEIGPGGAFIGPGTSSGNFATFSSAAISANNWFHIAFTRVGATLQCFVNGTSIGTATASVYASNVDNGALFGIGSWFVVNNTYDLAGYLSNLRVVKGAAVYTSNFTPSTTPLTAISGTSLLTCQSNRFIDSSSNNFAITVVGTPSVQRFSPFAPPAAYNPATIGGSGYFDGNRDYLAAPQSAVFAFDTGDFTIEHWVYGGTQIDAFPRTIAIGPGFSTGSVGFTFDDDDFPGKICFYARDITTSRLLISTTNVNDNAWHHVAVTRATGIFRLYVDGVLQATNNSFPSSSVGSGSQPCIIGGVVSEISGEDFVGYLGDVRIVKGSVVYTGNFTPPTAPLATITNTGLLLNYTNAAIFDNAMMNDLETVGNAQISTSVVKFGTGSLAFDGTGDYLQIPYSPNFQFGTGAYTIEFWINTTSTSVWVMFNAATDTGIRVFITSTGKIQLNEQVSNADNTATSTTSINNGAWNHVAFSRVSGQGTKVFINGVSEDQLGAAYNFSNTSTLYIATRSSLVLFFNGYIDDLRITKGVARYTANFTPPTAAFPDQ